MIPCSRDFDLQRRRPYTTSSARSLAVSGLLMRLQRDVFKRLNQIEDVARCLAALPLYTVVCGMSTLRVCWPEQLEHNISISWQDGFER